MEQYSFKWTIFVVETKWSACVASLDFTTICVLRVLPAHVGDARAPDNDLCKLHAGNPDAALFMRSRGNGRRAFFTNCSPNLFEWCERNSVVLWVFVRTAVDRYRYMHSHPGLWNCNDRLHIWEVLEKKHACYMQPVHFLSNSLNSVHHECKH